MDIWEEMEQRYVAGEGTYRELAKEFGVSLRQVSRRGKLRDWPKLRREGPKGGPKMQAMRENISRPAARPLVGNGFIRSDGMRSDAGGKDPAPRECGAVERITQKVLLRLEEALDSGNADPQRCKHITAVLKDLQELQREKSGAQTVEVVLGEAEKLSR